MSTSTITYENVKSYAQKLDSNDPLKSFRKQFYIPEQDKKSTIYFCGNSLGLQPKSTKFYVEQELLDWRNMGVKGHHEAKYPWLYYHHFFEAESLLVGAKPSEVVVMNALTVNLHLMMVSFFRPEGKRTKIMMEAGAFPSDQYAVQSQLEFHGLDYEDNVIEVAPRAGEHCLRTEDIIDQINLHKDELALVLFSGVNYLTGQYFDLPSITEAGHKVGARVGFDLAHATGNVPMELHNWGVDFAVWCTYKYLNSGPGGVSAAFVHERHGNDATLPRFAGWWGNDEATRFQMKRGFHPQEGAAGWQTSNAPVLSMAAHKASLDLFEEAGMGRLREKSELLTGYLEFLIQDIIKTSGKDYTIITPDDPKQRGAQLSILTGPNGKALFDELTRKGVVLDWREPNVIRVAPVPLYNSFMDVWEFAQILREH